VDPVDWQDVKSSLEGDGEAFERIVRRYQDRIAAYMWRFTRDRAQWEELVHDVFVEAYVSLPGYKSRAPLLHWLRRIATRTGYRWWKTRDRRRAEAPESLDAANDVATTGNDESAAREAAATVHALLAQMSHRDRLVLTLIHLEECSVAETARLTGWSQSMVKVQAHRARKRLAKLCRQLEIEP